MMSHAWPIVLHGGLLSPRGYPPLYALMLVSHRVLRYAAPFAHVARCSSCQRGAASASTRCTRSPSRCSSRCSPRRCWPDALPLRPLLVARYYVLTTASVAAGLWDWLRHGTPAVWEPADGTR